MEDLTDFLHRMGVPAWAIAIIASGYILFDKLKPWTKRGKSDREILSADEQGFRKDLLGMVKASHERCAAAEKRCDIVETKLSVCEDGHAQCRAENKRLSDRVEQMIAAATSAGVRLAVELAPEAPMPTSANELIHRTQKET